MASRPEELRLCLSLQLDSPALAAFLRGEEINAPGDWKGWCGVAAGSVVTGFGKCSGGRLKNRYPKGLRSF